MAQIKVTRLQAELARAKVEADRARHRTPDPLLVKIAAAAAPDEGDSPDDDTPDDGTPHDGTPHDDSAAGDRPEGARR